MTDHPAPVRTHTWDGTRTLPDWLTGHHWTKGRLTIRTVDGDSHPRPGWMLIGWSDGAVTVASPRIAEREYGPDGPWARAERAEEELAARDAAESADAAAGSYALRAEEVEARLAQVRRLHRPVGVVAAAEAGEAPDCAACKRSWPCQTYTAIAEPEPVVDRQTALVLSALYRSAEETVTRVIDLYEQWVKAGAPPLGVSMARWWDARLVELHDAIRPAAHESTRTTVKSQPKGGSSD